MELEQKEQSNEENFKIKNSNFKRQNGEHQTPKTKVQG
jgi:hypothetical protein